MAEPEEAAPVGGASLSQAVAGLGGANVLAFGAGIVRQKVFAVYLGAGGYGAYALAWALFELLTSVARLGIPTGVLREMGRAFSAGDRPRAARTFLMARRLGMGAAVLLGGGAGLLSLVWDGAFPRSFPRWALLAVIVAVPLSLAGEIADAAINALHDIRRLVVGKVATLLVSLALAVGLIAGLGLPGAILQIATGAGAGMVVAHVLLRGRFRPAAHHPEAVPPEQARAILRAVLTVGIAQGIYHIAVTGNLLAFRSLVADTLGLEANGIYQGVIGLSRQYTGAVMGGVFVYGFPRLASLTESRERFAREMAAGLSFLLAIAVPAALLLLGFREWIVRLVFTEEFLPMVPLLGILAGADVLSLVTISLHVGILASGSARSFLALGVVSEGLYLVLFLAGLGALGLPGAVGALLVRGAVMIPVFAFLLVRQGRLHFPPSLRLQAALGAVLIAALAALPPEGLLPEITAPLLAGGWLWGWRGAISSRWRTGA